MGFCVQARCQECTVQEHRTRVGLAPEQVFIGLDAAASCSVLHLHYAHEFKVIRIRKIGRFSPT